MFCSSVGRCASCAFALSGSTRMAEGSDVDLRERDVTTRGWRSGEEGADWPLSMSKSLSEEEEGLESIPAMVKRPLLCVRTRLM